MASAKFQTLKGSVHPHPSGSKKLSSTDGDEEITVTILLRRKPGHVAPQASRMVANLSDRPSRDAFIDEHGADPQDLSAVEAYAESAGLAIVKSSAARRSVKVRGTADAISKAFDVQLNEYQHGQKLYRSHDEPVQVPASLAASVEAVVGLTNRQVNAVHYATPAAHHAALDPANTVPLTPAQVADLYNFPAGDGAGQTIGLYEMETGEGPAGYALDDIQGSLKAMGNLPLPKIVNVSVNGTQNSGQSDGETGLDITVAGAIAPAATIAVYFTGGQVQDIINALQEMILPEAGEPAPSVISISYGWGPDDQGSAGFSESEFAQITKLFEDAATNKITVLVSSGDSGAFIESRTEAQVSYPASDVWVTACGGTTIGSVRGSSFEEWVWNDGNSQNPAATGGGVSARFAVPDYQQKLAESGKLPKHLKTSKAGRGIPDIAGNASENSGYLQVIGGSEPEPVGGTSAVAPLYAGLVARINTNLKAPVGFLNTLLYTLPETAFNDIVGKPGPANNSAEGVTGYPAGTGWDACTGLGSVKGQALQDAIAAASQK